jgi:hypothetical protein
MKDAWEVLRQKALELSRVEQEVEALRVAAVLRKNVSGHYAAQFSHEYS